MEEYGSSLYEIRRYPRESVVLEVPKRSVLLKDSRPRPTTGWMIDPINAASAAAGARLSQTTPRAARATVTSGGASFAGELARYVSAPAPSTASPSTASSGTASSGTVSSAVKAAARPDNEQTKKITGHPYARIENGNDKGMYLNQLESSPRAGAVFKLVERDDRVFHVYGDGKDKVVVEVKKKDAAASTAPTAPTGGTAPDAT